MRRTWWLEYPNNLIRVASVGGRLFPFRAGKERSFQACEFHPLVSESRHALDTQVHRLSAVSKP